MGGYHKVEHQLKAHRRDELIDWIKEMLSVSFVLHSSSEFNLNTFSEKKVEEFEIKDFDLNLKKDIEEARKQKYIDIFKDIEKIFEEYFCLLNSNCSNSDIINSSVLKKLVPSIGNIHIKLPLVKAFLFVDQKKMISKRKLVFPSFNDIRMILNMSQIIALTDEYISGSEKKLKLITFDGDCTLYLNGECLKRNDPIVKILIELLSYGFYVSIVTAANYYIQSASYGYYEKLKGLIDEILNENVKLTDIQKNNLFVVGAQSNYFYRYSSKLKKLIYIDEKDCHLPSVQSWDVKKIDLILIFSKKYLTFLQKKFNLTNKTVIIKKERSVGIVPLKNFQIVAEILEEIVLSCSYMLDNLLLKLHSNSFEKKNSDDIKVCAFNGGSDVWIDIGNKSLGVKSLQHFLLEKDKTGKLKSLLESETLHFGDQFSKLGSNDFVTRSSACTVWVLNPNETLEILQSFTGFLKNRIIIK